MFTFELWLIVNNSTQRESQVRAFKSSWARQALDEPRLAQWNSAQGSLFIISLSQSPKMFDNTFLNLIFVNIANFVWITLSDLHISIWKIPRRDLWRSCLMPASLKSQNSSKKPAAKTGPCCQVKFWPNCSTKFRTSISQPGLQCTVQNCLTVCPFKTKESLPCWLTRLQIFQWNHLEFQI